MTPSAERRSVLAALRRHWILFAVAFIATASTVVVGTLAMTPLYEATAKVMIQLGREFSSQVTIGDRQTVLNRDAQSALNTELHILLSQDLIESVVAQIGPERLYPRPATSQPGDEGVSDEEVSEEAKLQAATRRLAGAFTARLLPQSSVLQISLRHPDPAIARDTLAALFEEYRGMRLDAYGNPQVPPFLQEKVAEFRARLDESEDRLQAFLAENEAMGGEGERADALLTNERARLDAELKQQSSRVAGLQQQIHYLTEQRQRSLGAPEIDTASQQNDMIERARLKLLDLQVEQERLLGTYSESSRPVTAIRGQIKLVEDFLTEQERMVAGGRASEAFASEETRLNAELQFELARGRELSRQLVGLDQDLAALPDRARRYRDLIRARDLNERYLSAYLQELEENRLTSDLDREKIANIVLIQAVRVAPNPVSPNRRLNVAVGAVLALIVGAAAAFGAEMWSSSRATAPAPSDADDADAASAHATDAERQRGVATPFGGRIEGPRVQGPRQL